MASPQRLFLAGAKNSPVGQVPTEKARFSSSGVCCLLLLAMFSLYVSPCAEQDGKSLQLVLCAHTAWIAVVG